MTFNSNSLILVAVINNPRDLEIARILGWYRIPISHAPKVVQVDYLAFYQTAAFQANRWCIQWIAPVLGHELVTRAELIQDEKDHPRAQSLYYKMQLGPLEPLEHPIRAEKWKRITFFYTTGEYITRAETLHELVVQSDERKWLWQALRERGSNADQYAPPDSPDFEVTPELLDILLGIQMLERDPHTKNQT
ncbi:MAG: hypothetical protein ACK2UW_05875 [Anaerolineales bacterium]|jgi:hypothetical protein